MTRVASLPSVPFMNRSILPFSPNRQATTRSAWLRTPLGLLACCGWLTFCIAGQVARGQGTQSGGVLLKNDRVLLGQVQPQGDVFIVRIADQSNISLAKDQVVFVGRDLEDIYQFKLRSIANWNVGDHFKLTRWCMVNDMLDKAAHHYQEVAKQAGSHPRVQQLAIELKTRMLEVAEFREFLGLQPLRQPTSGGQLAQPNAPQSQSTQPDVKLASGSFHAAQHPHVVSRFNERIQPILLNRCSQAACHGGQSSNSLKLIEPYSKTFSQNSSDNLAQVLAQVASDPETLSPLLDFATRAHGIQRHAGIAVTETELITELREWIRMVQNPVVTAVGTSSQLSPATTPAVANQPLAGARRAAVDALQPVSPGAASLKQVPRGGAEPLVSDSEIEALEAQLDAILGPAARTPATTAPPNASLDPFDPAEFNRRSQQTSGR